MRCSRRAKKRASGPRSRASSLSFGSSLLKGTYPSISGPGLRGGGVSLGEGVVVGFGGVCLGEAVVVGIGVGSGDVDTPGISIVTTRSEILSNSGITRREETIINPVH